MPILILRLEGILQRWGERAQWDFRDTAPIPTKSGVMGLAACALGYARGDARILELDKRLCFGVRVDRGGMLMEDFHTVTTDQKSMTAATGKPRNGGPTIITPRQYLQDACFTVALQGERALLEKIRNALAAPRWQVYLGAKSCVPSRPLLETLTDEYGSLEQALKSYPRPKRHDSSYIEIEDAQGGMIHYDRIQDIRSREYGFRKARVLPGGEG